ncbi:MAG TPA: helix-turn-helix domain-containing protein [Gaiellaceae bacterium]|nr:helix-turn-helix domain-containing protein [Gaiellaceae bacterium]
MYVARRSARSSASQARILEAVRSLLEEGTFHETTVEEVAARAGVSRATLYQHFGSRLGLLGGICDAMDANPVLAAVRRTSDLEELVAAVVEFWASEERLLAQLYHAAAIDPAAQDFVERQRRDRYGELRRVLGEWGGERFAALAVATSFESYLELRRGAGLSKEAVVRTLQGLARTAASK